MDARPAALASPMRRHGRPSMCLRRQREMRRLSLQNPTPTAPTKSGSGITISGTSHSSYLFARCITVRYVTLRDHHQRHLPQLVPPFRTLLHFTATVTVGALPLNTEVPFHSQHARARRRGTSIPPSLPQAARTYCLLPCFARDATVAVPFHSHTTTSPAHQRRPLSQLSHTHGRRTTMIVRSPAPPPRCSFRFLFRPRVSNETIENAAHGGALLERAELDEADEARAALAQRTTWRLFVFLAVQKTRRS